MKFRVADGVISKRLHDEIVLLDYERGTYYGLDGVGARVWDLLEALTPREELVATLLGEFDVDRITLERDVDTLLAQLTERGLLKAEAP